MFSQFFLSQQVKEYVIITYTDGIYELSYEFLIKSRDRILGN